MDMSKTSKRKPASTLITVPKTRLNKDMKHMLLGHMEAEFEARIDDAALSETYIALLEKVNAILRAKYPEADMPVLRKYKLNRVDTCLRFTILGTERIFGIRLQPPGKVKGDVADIPCTGGCYSNNDIFPCDKDLEILADKWTNQVEERRLLVLKKRGEYQAFLHACRYLEDVEAVLPLSDEVRRVLGAGSRSISTISPDVIERIKSDFAQGVAA
jgi:hypothetical protein